MGAVGKSAGNNHPWMKRAIEEGKSTWESWSAWWGTPWCQCWLHWPGQTCAVPHNSGISLSEITPIADKRWTHAQYYWFRLTRHNDHLPYTQVLPHTHTHAHTHTYIHTHAHTQTHTCSLSLSSLSLLSLSLWHRHSMDVQPSQISRQNRTLIWYCRPVMVTLGNTSRPNRHYKVRQKWMYLRREIMASLPTIFGFLAGMEQRSLKRSEFLFAFNTSAAAVWCKTQE